MMSKKNKIDIDQLAKIRHLAMLGSQDENSSEMLEAVGNILDAFGRISHIDTEGVEPMFLPPQIKPKLRQDSEDTALVSPDELRECSHSKLGNLYKVKKMIDQK